MHIADALSDLGHTVTCLQEDRVPVHEIEAEAAVSNLLLFTRTWGSHNPTDMHAMFTRLRQAGIPTASYHLDLYIGLDREATILGDPFWSTRRVFHPDGSPEADRALTAAGIQHHVLPPAVAADECFQGTPRPDFDHDAIFVGSANPYGHATEWPFRDRLVAHLATTYRLRFAHYGPGGLRTVRNGINGDRTALNDLYASARVVVGDSIYRPGYVSDRLTETLGRGGLLVFPRSPTVEQLGYVDYRTSSESDAHYIGYEPGNLDDLDRAISIALALPAVEADAMRTEATAHTLAHHTFTHRMATLLDIMGIR